MTWVESKQWTLAWGGWQEKKYPCFLEIPPKEKFCIQISQSSLIINSSYRLIKKAKLSKAKRILLQIT